MMRILVAHCSYRSPGGEDRYVRDQLELLRAGHEVTLLDCRNETLVDGLGTALQMGWSPGATREVERRIAHVSPDVVHLHNAYPGFGPAMHLAAERQGVPLVMTVHNQRLRCPNGLMFTRGEGCQRCAGGRYLNATLHHCFPTMRQSVAYASTLWLHRFVLRLEERVTRFIAPSVFMAQRLAAWGISRHRITVVRNFTWPSPDACSEVGSFGLYAGRLSSEKGIEDLLQALRKAGDPPFRIVGSGPLDELVRAQVSQLGLRRTEIVGRLTQSEVRRTLRQARFVVIPSRCEENAPLAAIEGLSEGRPLIVTSAGGLPELAEEGRGLICDRGDVDAMAKAIQQLMDDSDLCRSAGSRARTFYSQALHPEVHRDGLEAAYRHATSSAYS
jgi:glycosyltransferase involved in cell wall biosynthesis